MRWFAVNIGLDTGLFQRMFDLFWRFSIFGFRISNLKFLSGAIIDMAKYKIAIIGSTGRGDYGHGLDAIWQKFDDCEVVAVADQDAAGLQKALTRTKMAFQTLPNFSLAPTP